MADKKQRIHVDIIYEAETSQFLSEKSDMGGKVPEGTLTSRSGFAAINWPFMTGKLYQDEF